VQRSAIRLAEVPGEEDQGNEDEQREDRAPAPDLLVMHEGMFSKVELRSALTVSRMKRWFPSGATS
jgi:hypothetical protein